MVAMGLASKQKKLLFVQPILASYRDPLFKGLSKILSGGLGVCAGKSTSEFGAVVPEGYDFVEVNWSVLCGMHIMPLRTMIDCYRSSQKIIHVADFKYLSLWIYLVCSLMLGKKIWLHGQGGYKKTGLLHRCVYVLSVFMSSGYICYADYSRESLRKLLPRFLHRKISVVSNTLYLEPVEVVSKAQSSDIFYIGRLRSGCGLDILLEAARLSGVRVRIVGDGDASYINMLKEKYDCGVFYGGMFGREEQLDIAKCCMAGAYGGDAGLSVVHYMAFGLPVLVHESLVFHMGPEPTYVKNNVNGLNFKRGNPRSLANKITMLKDDKELCFRLANGALETFNDLRSITMEDKFASIIGCS